MCLVVSFDRMNRIYRIVIRSNCTVPEAMVEKTQ
jgi:hypothetical protein